MPMTNLRFTRAKFGSQDGQNLLARIEADEHRRRMLIRNPSVLVRVS